MKSAKTVSSHCLIRRLQTTVNEKRIWKLSVPFMMLCTTTMILTAFQQEAFWKDTVDFFYHFLEWLWRSAGNDS